MPEVIEPGEHGLYYLTDKEERGIFIAAATWQEASQLAALARAALVSGGEIPKHVLHDHVSGTKITVPIPDPMTPEQRKEAIARLQKHLRERIYG